MRANVELLFDIDFKATMAIISDLDIDGSSVSPFMLIAGPVVRVVFT